jgi:type III restriction enzyme
MQSQGDLTMDSELRIQFDANQKHQLDAVESVVRLFEGLPQAGSVAFALGDEIVSNLPPYRALSEPWLYDNLRTIQQENQIKLEKIEFHLETDGGFELEGVSIKSCPPYPHFTIEMETGTGKTYVYLRTIYELRKRYGFGKFIIVVPSIAIYEGVIKNFQITRDHFRALYENETVNLIEYEGSKISQLRAFATSTFVEVLVITLDSFNKASNVIFKPSEKLPGERLPYQFLQETRPILILDEPQNMSSDRSKEALRTLHPLFALRYSATHKETPNLVYRLTPFDAYRLNLVKKIQVYGVTERENFNQPFLGLEAVDLQGGIKARLRTYTMDHGRVHEANVTLKHGEDLYAKTHYEEHRDKYIVTEINAVPGGEFIEFENGIRLSLHDTLGPNRPEVFRAQIRKTIEQHFEMQERLRKKNVKVLSLFFIDRVANYVNANGIIRRIFDEEFEKYKRRSEFFEQWKAEEVRSAYFAVYRGRPVDTREDNEEKQSKDEREAEKAAFELIMKQKERLLGFYDGKDDLKKTCFIFAHSALKEGWDNPNVFQICTLRQTSSEMRKRQEIGRGLRLAVDQEGKRVFDDDVNVLSVVANESYQSYAAKLQTEYVEAGQTPPPRPTNPGKTKACRNDAIFESTQAFRDFWAKLQRHTEYSIRVDTPALIENCVERLNNKPTPQATIVVEHGTFVVTEYCLELLSISQESCKIKISITDTLGNESMLTHTFDKKSDLPKVLKDERLRGYKIVQLIEDGDISRVVFGNGEQLFKHAPIRFQSEQGQRSTPVAVMAPRESYPVFNLIDRAAKETGLTRPTINAIFRALTEKKKQSIFANPEGFASQFITEINNALADHVAERIEFVVKPAPTGWGYDLEDLFPKEKEFPQKELVEGSSASLYDQIQYDSEVERNFVINRLNKDNEVVFYFKFPPAFKIQFPRILGNYNPDWGIARYSEDGKMVLELVRETKGREELEGLQFPSERRKIECAQKHFQAVGIDYRVVTDQVPDWWRAGEIIPEQPKLWD